MIVSNVLQNILSRGRTYVLTPFIVVGLSGCASGISETRTIAETDYVELNAVPLVLTCVLEEPCNADPTNIQTFDDLVLAANTYAPNVLESRNDVARAFDRLETARRSRFFTPSVQASATVADGVTPGVQFSQPLWHGGRISGQIELASIEVQRAVRAYDVLRFELIEQIASQYQALDEVDRTLTVRQLELADLNGIKDMTASRVDGALDTADSLGAISVKIASLDHTLTDLQLSRQTQLDELGEKVGVVILLDETAMPTLSGKDLLDLANRISNMHSNGQSTVFETYADLNVRLFEEQARLNASKALPALDFVVSWDVVSTPQVGIKVASSLDPLFYDPALRYPTIRNLDDALERQVEAERFAAMRMASLLNEARTLTRMWDASTVRLKNARDVFDIETERYTGQGGSTSQLIASREVLSDASVQIEQLRSRMGSVYISLKAYERSFASDTE